MTALLKASYTYRNTCRTIDARIRTFVPYQAAHVAMLTMSWTVPGSEVGRPGLALGLQQPVISFSPPAWWREGEGPDHRRVNTHMLTAVYQCEACVPAATNS